eukprot:TRINITY_DN9975_c0_g1_i1.p1 TRINITY_DN9975_c0_g1~~TRINITY_DN9975_c0_g1_i1.p1  ORF type:complete len:719 (+),score=167.68 TRINITY_DN9975_c0_g1_i1:50-2206(+)
MMLLGVNRSVFTQTMPRNMIQRTTYMCTSIATTMRLRYLSSTASSYTDDSKPTRKFKLSKAFIEKYKVKQPPFGFGVLGELVYRRTYARVKPDSTNEQWYETVERVVNGTYNMQKRWIEQHGLEWNSVKAQSSAQEMFARIFQMKFLPPGRGLWAMGSPLTETRDLYAALNNCAFVSTDSLKDHPSKPFCFLMDLSMLGVGVGFDTKGAETIVIHGPNLDKSSETFVIPDSREGWVESLRLLIDSYFTKSAKPIFDYTAIRPAGSEIKGFGGKSSGPDSLKVMHDSISSVLDNNIGKPITITTIVDLMNHIGRCVVSASARQTAEIAFGDPESDEYINLKNYQRNPHRAAYGWTSNNSVFANLGMNYNTVCNLIKMNGEPGLAWLENMQKYSRMQSTELDNKDFRAKGGNPCLEQTLESYELCCLVETFPNNHENLEDFKKTLKYAFLYAKTVTLGKTHWPESNKVMLRNRRIGTSMSGIAQFISQRGINEMKQWATEGYEAVRGYDRRYSDWLAIPSSIKTTSIKPSGTVSLLAGATPGMHYPISQYYIRRVRIAKENPLIPLLVQAGYKTEPAVDNLKNIVVEIPINAGHGLRKAKDISMWEQLNLASFLQKYWADNQVSCTVTFDTEKEGPQIPHALDYFQYQLKGVSFLPLFTDSYAQMPYEEISESTYNDMVKNLKPVNFNEAERPTHPSPDKFCDSANCVISLNIDSNESSP